MDEQNEYTTFSELVAAYKEKGESQKKLAERWGLSCSKQIRNWCNGTEISFAQIKLIKKHVDADEFRIILKAIYSKIKERADNYIEELEWIKKEIDNCGNTITVDRSVFQDMELRIQDLEEEEKKKRVLISEISSKNILLTNENQNLKEDNDNLRITLGVCKSEVSEKKSTLNHIYNIMLFFVFNIAAIFGVSHHFLTSKNEKTYYVIIACCVLGIEGYILSRKKKFFNSHLLSILVISVTSQLAFRIYFVKPVIAIAIPIYMSLLVIGILIMGEGLNDDIVLRPSLAKYENHIRKILGLVKFVVKTLTSGAIALVALEFVISILYFAMYGVPLIPAILI